eukprot:363901-Chlamydomonas_euryale.AAC.31
MITSQTAYQLVVDVIQVCRRAPAGGAAHATCRAPTNKQTHALESHKSTVTPWYRLGLTTSSSACAGSAQARGAKQYKSVSWHVASGTYCRCQPTQRDPGITSGRCFRRHPEHDCVAVGRHVSDIAAAGATGVDTMLGRQRADPETCSECTAYTAV